MSVPTWNSADATAVRSFIIPITPTVSGRALSNPEVGQGSDLAAWQEPALFAAKMRAAFRTVR
jgi:hypothetical protein